MTQTMRIDQMQVAIYPSEEELGRAAAEDLTQILRAAVAAQGEAAIILATGNSQLAFLRALREFPGVAWERITVLHMDEYLGMSPEHPASFRRYLQEHLVDAVHPGAFHGITGDTGDVAAELARYAALLEEHRPVACVLGIGENGHLAFNDPPADWTTQDLIHVVSLDEACRGQQVGEGHFATLDDVPRQALSLTIPALLRPPHVLAVVPEARKAPAVRAALLGPVTPLCPASILRTAPHVKLYLDRASASLL
jgi:glucosamine-6-phosphate deaminase